MLCYVLYLIFTHAYSTNVEQREKKNININTKQKKGMRKQQRKKERKKEEEEGKNNINKQTEKEIGITEKK